MSSLLQSIVAEILTNYSQSDTHSPSHHVRKEGWTEVWGKKITIENGDNSIDVRDAKSYNCQLIQYRVAWAAQLLLRQSKIPHVVLNTPYLSNQSTGSYPQYRNLTDRTMVGNNDILAYLVAKHNVDSGLTPKQESEKRCLASLIQELNELQKALRYADANAWNEIYRKQCINASTLHGTDNLIVDHSKRIHGLAWFQAWSERAIHLKSLRLGSQNRRYFVSNKLDVKKVVQLAKDAYQALNYKMAESKSGAIPSLLDTEHLCSVDMLLFEHLANSLCDIHLISILDEQDHLIKFFQDIYQNYFKEFKMTHHINTEDIFDDWVWMNNVENSKNQFNRIPLNDYICSHSIHGDQYRDVIHIMKRVAIQCHDLKEILSDINIQKTKEDKMFASSTGISKAGLLLHKIRMLGDPTVKSDEADDSDDEYGDEIMKKNRQQMKKIIREAKKNDELWISGVLLVAAIGVFAASNSE